MSSNRRRWGRTSLLRIVATVGLLALVGAAAVAAEELDGVPVGLTADGRPYKGATDALLTLHEYSDYLCPFCARYFAQTLPSLVEDQVRQGRLRIVFHHFPIEALHPTARAGHLAAACVGEQGAVPFWRFHDQLFERQAEWNRLADPDDFLTSLVDELGLDRVAYETCRASERPKAIVDRAVEEAEARGFNGTPTFELVQTERPEERHRIIGARPAEYFTVHIEALLEGREPPQEPEPPKPELPDWAKAEALAPDPKRPELTVSGDPTRGAADASLVIVEFTDYQCPACARHLSDTQPTLDRELVAPGKVRWVYKTLPLPEHPNAAAAAVAAECAIEQERFQPMHRALFERQGDWAEAEPPDAALGEIAESVGLDAARFADCLAGRSALERVLRDVHDSSRLTRSTPTFVLLDGESGRTLSGALTAERFLASVNGHLESLR